MLTWCVSSAQLSKLMQVDNGGKWWHDVRAAAQLSSHARPSLFISKVSKFARPGIPEQNMTQTLQDDIQIQLKTRICHRCDQVCLVGHEIQGGLFLSPASFAVQGDNEASHCRQNHAASRLALRHSYFPTFLITQSPKHQISMSIMPQEMGLLECGGLNCASALTGWWMGFSSLAAHCFNELSRQRLSSC